MTVDYFPLGTEQLIQQKAVNSTVTGAYPHTYYTCPTGKKALVDVVAHCDAITNLGASVRVISSGIVIGVWLSQGTLTANPPNTMCGGTTLFDLGVRLIQTVLLVAGEAITDALSAGANATTTIHLIIKELPA